MGLFGNKEKKSEAEIPALPRLPRLPDFPMEPMEDRMIHQLPSFPSNSIGKRFSQDSIKDAVSGEKADFYADDFSDGGRRMMREPLRKPLTEEVEDEIEEEFPERMEKPRETFRQELEPVFVRIDRFEEGLKLFETIKNQISGIEKVLEETKRLKEKEGAELLSWENELKKMKGEIEKIGRDIFSKI
jgi:hypothetical protein